VQELSPSGAVVAEHPRAEVKDAGPYRRVQVRFRTAPSAQRIRFIMDIVQTAPYTESHVTLDDCALSPAP